MELVQYLIEQAAIWPGVVIRYREDWQCDYFSVADKSFCMLGKMADGRLVMTIKGLPEENEQLREEYADVLPGYYANKTHWNSFLLAESSFTNQQLVAFLQQSYALVFAKLPKKIQQMY